MGAWGSGHFENDDASDWVWSLADDDDASTIRDALEAVARPSDEKVDATEASCALAAAAVVAAAIGRPTGDQLPEEAETWIEAHGSKVGEDLAALAREAVDRVKQDSELRELWEDDAEWLNAVAELQSCLPPKKPAKRRDRSAAKPAVTKVTRHTESATPGPRDFLFIYPTSDAASIAPDVDAMAVGGRVRVDRSRAPLPDEVVAAMVAALARRPDLEFSIVGGDSLEWITALPLVRRLSVHGEGLDVTPIGELHELRELTLGRLGTEPPMSLAFLAGTPMLETLFVNNARDFEAVADLVHLRSLYVMHPSMTTLDFLTAHPALQGLAINWPKGDIHDLAPLSTMPKLRVLSLNDFPGVATSGFAAIGDSPSLIWLRISHFPAVEDLAAFARGPDTLRFLELYGMSGLSTLSHLAACRRLEEALLGASLPTDQRLADVAAAPALTYLEVDDEYPQTEVDAALAAFRGRCFDYRGKFLVGGRRTVGVVTRAKVEGWNFQLSVVDAEEAAGSSGAAGAG